MDNDDNCLPFYLFDLLLVLCLQRPRPQSCRKFSLPDSVEAKIGSTAMCTIFRFLAYTQHPDLGQDSRIRIWHRCKESDGDWKKKTRWIQGYSIYMLQNSCVAIAPLHREGRDKQYGEFWQGPLGRHTNTLSVSHAHTLYNIVMHIPDR
jgi:hypothetical protein